MRRPGAARVQTIFDTMDFTGMHARFLAHREALLARMTKVVDEGRFVQGPEVAELEQALSRYVSVGSEKALHAVTCASGTDALRLGLMALDIGAGHAVVVPAFGFAAAAEAVLLSGATPIFADIDPKTFNLDAGDVTRRLQAWMKTPAGASGKIEPRAIMAIDTFGLPADYEALRKAAEPYGLYLIEDAAQSLGATRQGRRAGALADMAVTSFYPTKILGCMGDGGAVFTARADWAERLRRLRDHGQAGKYWHLEPGLNSRLDTLQAAVLLEMLPDLDAEVAARRRIAGLYAEKVGAATSALADARMQNDEEETLVLPLESEGYASAWSLYTVRSTSRDAKVAALAARGVPTAIHYPRTLPENPAFKPWAEAPEAFPQALKASRQCLSLPLHGALKTNEIETIVTSLTTAWNARAYAV